MWQNMQPSCKVSDDPDTAQPEKVGKQTTNIDDEAETLQRSTDRKYNDNTTWWIIYSDKTESSIDPLMDDMPSNYNEMNGRFNTKSTGLRGTGKKYWDEWRKKPEDYLAVNL